MKASLLACCIWLITVSAVAQMPSSQPPDQNLYAVALKASVLEMEKEWGHIKGNSGQSQTDYLHMVVEKDPSITDALPTTFEGHVVEYLDDQALIERYDRLDKSYAILKVQPIQNDGAALKIAVLVYWISYNKHRLQHELSDWSNVEFRYDCDKHQFVVSSVKLGGI